MPVDPIKAVIQSIGVASRKERAQGNHGKANGWVLIALGIFTLPVPIVGIPLLVWGICLLNS